VEPKRIFLRLSIIVIAAISLVHASLAIAESKKPPVILSVPFDPPLEQDLLYSVIRTKISPEETRTTTSEQVLRFSVQEGGFILTLRYVGFSGAGISIKLDSPDAIKTVPTEMRPFVMPLAFDLNRDGEIVRVRNWPSIQAAFAEIPKMLAEENEGSKRDTVISIAEAVVKPFQNMTAEQAPNHILKGWPSVLGLGGLELEYGVEMEADGEIPSGLLPVAIPTKIRISLSQSANGRDLHFKQISITDEEVLGATLSKFMLNLGAGLPAQQRANLEKGADLIRRMRIEERLDIDFDASSGLVNKAAIERKILMDSQDAGGETLTISRVH
jgi:hypothetical protein